MIITILAALCVLLQITDAVTTLIGLQQPGNYEANGRAAKIMAAIGVVPTVLLGKCLIIALVVMLALTGSWLCYPVFVGIIGFYGWVAINNLKVVA